MAVGIKDKDKDKDKEIEVFSSIVHEYRREFGMGYDIVVIKNDKPYGYLVRISNPENRKYDEVHTSVVGYRTYNNEGDIHEEIRRKLDSEQLSFDFEKNINIGYYGNYEI